VRAKEAQSTDTFNSLVFHTNSAVGFGLAGMSGGADPNSYPYTLQYSF